MVDFNKISQQVSDVAERVADVADAAQGKGARSGGGTRGPWFLLPVAGAVGYVVAKKGRNVTRQVKDVSRQLSREAKERASELPDADLLARAKEFAGLGENGQERAEDSRKAEAVADEEQLEQNRRERAERRKRRRETTSV
jgi:hypothetical protein